MLGKVPKANKVKSTKKPLVKYNVMDIILNTSKDKVKAHNAVSELFGTKGMQGVLELKRSPVSKKDKSVFESNGFTFLYLLGTLMQLIHFEYLGIGKYEDFPSDSEGNKKTLKELPTPSGRIFSNKLQLMVQLLVDIIKYDAAGVVYLTELKKITDFCRTKPPVRFFPQDQIELTTVYSILDQFTENPASHTISYKNPILSFGEPVTANTTKMYFTGLESFSKAMRTCLSSLSELAKEHASNPIQLSEKIVILGLSQLFLDQIQPYLLFITAHTFCFADQIFPDCKHCMGRPESQGKFAKELEEKIWEKFGFIAISKKKIERDELREDIEGLAGAQYRKLYRDLSGESGLWFDKRQHKQEQKVFEYISSKYEKILAKCPLHSYLTKAGKAFTSNLGGFIKLKMSRDSLGRGQRTTNMDLMGMIGRKGEECVSFGTNFGYLRCFYIKKLLLGNLLKSKEKEKLHRNEFLRNDFELPIMKHLFRKVTLSSYRAASLSKHSKKSVNVINVLNDYSSDFGTSTNIPRNISSDSITKLETFSNSCASPVVQFEECIPKKPNSFEAEMITIYGAVFGTVVLNSVCVSFKSEERRTGRKYRFGSTPYNHCDKKMTKKWPLGNIRQVIVKRYNLLRQAVEIYLGNSKSVFLSFFHPTYRKRFIKTLNDYAKKKASQIEIIENAEQYFVNKKFYEKWRQCKMTNFEYLMLLNKYGGRSFNDLSQYPVFPWVIADYTSKTLSYKNPETYRQLKYPIAAISPLKRLAADNKFSSLLKEKDMDLYQFGSHYLVARMALGYLLRLEPFASLLIQFENGPDATARMFHTLENQWFACNNDTLDNKELIPEFFYLPEMFANYNKYSFGVKRAEGDLAEVVRNSVVRVDQVIVPKWAKDNHHFVQANFLALESKTVSLGLDQWIDLVFGVKQQDQRYYNRFKELCDEETIYRQANRLSESQIVEIQEFGSNPIKLFREKHVAKDKSEFDKRTQQAIFPNENSDLGYAGVLSQTCAFQEPVVYLEAFDKKVLFILNNQRIYRTKDEPLKIVEGKSIAIENKDVLLVPFKRILLEAHGKLPCDYQRTIASIEGGNFVITCRHYDNSCKIFSLTTESVIHHLYFHKSMVSAICLTKDKRCLFTGSQDGTLAMWELNEFKTKRPKVVWYACDHNLGIATLDTSRQLDLVASGSADGIVTLRIISTGKFFRRIKPELGGEYTINQIRLSPRGYMLIISKPKSKTEQNYLLTVYSINGEKVASKQALGTVNCVLMDETGYQFITGGSGGMLYRFDLLSLDSCNMLNLLSEGFVKRNEVLEHITSGPNTVTALGMTAQEGPQQLLIGVSSGEVLLYQQKKKVDTGKICDSIHGLLSGSQIIIYLI
eukprot:TRINITY_DN4786_c0_g1_i1.p1 TRINITY_DN4786_c0_g1~~TRINITY_DN4786_c0_g1_i1.p1  ORF type:complete len:1362 (+),score=136.82 TRINITY_DN4786_c0_g1_i1:10189-14274(+)